MKKTFFINRLFIYLFIFTGILFTRNELFAGESAEPKSLAVCSFNIQFLGISKVRDNKGLAAILKDFDIVVVQELVAPPYPGVCPVDSTVYKGDPEAAMFFDDMDSAGFKYILSSEDTGPGENNHNNGTATEWWVTFYKPGKVESVNDKELPTEFLDPDRTNNPSYDRVPYAFSFRTPDKDMDFVLISVHLHPDGSKADKKRRKEELAAIRKWIDKHDQKEKDFIILGDMNIEDLDELNDSMPKGFKSLNAACIPTNTNVNGPKPYDQVMYRSRYSKEIEESFGFRVYNLIEAMRPFWKSAEPYPGGALNPVSEPPYNHNKFRALYSDHHPVVFEMAIPDQDDD